MYNISNPKPRAVRFTKGVLMDFLVLFSIVCLVIGAVLLIAQHALWSTTTTARRIEMSGLTDPMLAVGLAMFALALLPLAIVAGNALGLAVGMACACLAGGLMVMRAYGKTHGQ